MIRSKPRYYRSKPKPPKISQLKNVSNWNKLKRRYSGEIDLSYSSMNAAMLREADLSKTNLSFSDLSRAKISNSNLKKANLQGANLLLADLRESNLSQCNLSNANLSGANLEGAILTGTNFENAIMSNVIWKTGDMIKDGISANKKFWKPKKEQFAVEIEQESKKMPILWTIDFGG